MSTPLPWSIAENPRLENWVDFSQPDLARVFTAKVELGQGIVTAMAQIAAEELRLPLSKIVVVSGDTRYSPNESYTAGSMSIEIGGLSLRMACAQAREAIIKAAAAKLAVDVSRIDVEDGAILLDGSKLALDYWAVAPAVDWHCEIDGSSALGKPQRSVGKSTARADLPAKVTGGAFIHDLELPGMLHGRVLRPPSNGAHLQSLDSASVERLPGVIKVWRSGDFVGVCCEREYQAIKALEALRLSATWSEDDSPIDQNWNESLPRFRSVDSEIEQGTRPAGVGDVIRVSATYSKPPIAHAAMGPSCAIALFDGNELTVWTHSQGVFPLRAALATALKISEERIIVIHQQGAGCYGHNGADDVALDAALLARQVPSHPVRVIWTRADELAWSPVGSPMLVKIEAALAASGDIVEWSTEIWSGAHGRRPSGRAVNLLAAAHTDPAIPFPKLHEDVRGFAGGARNSEPSYHIAHRRLKLHSLPELPFRTSALRTLGGYANVFAAESFVDELAEAVRADPVEFRLRHLTDPRARRVIETVARMAQWHPDSRRGTGRGRGIGFCRYKNTAAYVAVIAEVEVDRAVRVLNTWSAVDAGLAINPDGIINQIEGGIVQAISWTLKEAVKFQGHRVSTSTWTDYPILGFDEIPEVEVELIRSPDEPPLGVGEAAQGPTGAAVANAVACALDYRIRELPLTSERIRAAIAK